ncbi:MAG: thioredoxin domain-containing protein [Deferribacterales bacterium]
MLRIVTFIFIALFSISLFANDVAKTLEKNLLTNFEKRGLKNVDVNVSIVKKLDKVKGFYLVKVVITDKTNNKKVNQFLVSDGNLLLPDLVVINQGSSLVKELIFMYDITNINTSNLTLIHGNRNSKNVIVKVSDFECPFCRKANEYLMEHLKNKKDVALYLIHYPLSIHKKAMLYSRILEAGLRLNKNFTSELYSGKYDNMDEKQIINTFAKMTGKELEFKKLLDSKEINDKITQHMKIAENYGINSTPVIFFNGRKVEGFNTQLIDKGLSLIK